MKQKNIFVFTLLFCVILCVPQYVTAQSYSVSMGDIYKEEGIASWYGPDFDGRPTASGEIFDSSQFTAAHPTLPFGTFVVVTNKQNNRQITVKVNDRGPFVAGRIIDLSKAAAEHIDMINAGAVPVIIETLPSKYLQPPAAQPVAPAQPTPPPAQPTAAIPEPVVQAKPEPVVEPKPEPATPPPPPAEKPYQLPPITVNVYAPPPAQPAQPEPSPPASYNPPSPTYAQPEPYPPANYYAPPAPPPTYAQPEPYPPANYYASPEPPPPPPPTYAQPEPPPPPIAALPPAQTMPVYEPLPPVNPEFKLSPSISPLPDKVYKLQIGSYKIPRNAVEAFDRLKAAGLNPAYEQNDEFYRVVLAGIRGTEVQTVTQKLERAGFREALIREDK